MKLYEGSIEVLPRLHPAKYPCSLAYTPPTPRFENPLFFSFFQPPSTKGARASDGSTLSMSSDRCMRVTRQAGGSQREEEEEDSFGILISPENQRLRRCPLPATRREKQSS